MPNQTLEQRGLPPTRPYPSQVMHLLELTKLDLDTAATVIHQPPANLEKWMTFNVREAMPTAQWLLLNIYTYCIKNICWPEGFKQYIKDRFPNSFPDNIAPVKRCKLPTRPPVPTADEVNGLLQHSGTTLEELVFVRKNMVNLWLGAEKRPIPFAVYELVTMTLWARQLHIPDQTMLRYIQEKYNGVFSPK